MSGTVKRELLLLINDSALKMYRDIPMTFAGSPDGRIRFPPIFSCNLPLIIPSIGSVTYVEK